MKYIIVLGDGMADERVKELGDRTPLEAARKPAIDALARHSEIGLAYTIPEGMAPGSDTANLAVLGYDPRKFYSGRSPLEALSIGADLKSGDVSLRCNLVTLTEDDAPYEDQRIIDHSSGELDTKDGAVLIKALREGLGLKDASCRYKLYAGTGYRHLLICEGMADNGRPPKDYLTLTPPHDILTKRIGDYLPENPILKEMMKKSHDILSGHPLNKARRAAGLNPANSAWFWGAGTRPALTSFYGKTGKKGVMISAVDLLKGIAVGVGMKVINVEGATGGLKTNYEGKARAALYALLKGGYDFAYIHVEAPDEMGHMGLASSKVEAIEQIDERVVKVLAGELKKTGEDYRMLVMPDHPTPVSKRTHTADPVPYMIYDSRKDLGKNDIYSEKAARKSGIIRREGYKLIDHLLETDE